MYSESLEFNADSPIIIIGLFATLPLMLIKKIRPVELINKNI